jgi:ABC-type polysaccharide/polyol phosphate export permease
MYLILSSFVGVDISLHVLYLPILILNFILFISAAQLILSVMFLLLTDITHLWDKIRLTLFWLSGIVYDVNDLASPLKEILLLVNPFAGIIMNARFVLVYGQQVNYSVMLYDLFYGIVVFVIALFVNRYLYYKALDRL